MKRTGQIPIQLLPPAVVKRTRDLVAYQRLVSLEQIIREVVGQLAGAWCYGDAQDHGLDLLERINVELLDRRRNIAQRWGINIKSQPIN